MTTVKAIPMLVAATYSVAVKIGMLATSQTITGFWTAASITNWMTSTHIVLAIHSFIIIIAHTIVALVKVGMFPTVVAVAALWTMAVVFLAKVMTFTNVERAVFLGPVLIANTGVIGQVAVLYTFCTVTGGWSIASITDRMANGDVFSAVMTTPMFCAFAVSAVVKECICDAPITIACLRTSTSRFITITMTHIKTVLRAVRIIITWKALTSSICIACGVWYAVLTVFGTGSEAGMPAVTEVVTASYIVLKLAIFACPRVFTNTLTVFVTVGVRDTVNAIGGVGAYTIAITLHVTSSCVDIRTAVPS